MSESWEAEEKAERRNQVRIYNRTGSFYVEKEKSFVTLDNFLKKNLCGS